MPLFAAVDWFLTNTRLDDVVKPSIVCSPDSVMFAVVATNTGALVFKPWAILSTYCLVANCNALTGSCVTATLVKPPNVRLVAPSAMFVVPIVTELFVSELLPILVSVFVEPLIVTPANDVSVPPNAMLLEPSVIELFAKLLFGIGALIWLGPILIVTLAAAVIWP